MVARNCVPRRLRRCWSRAPGLLPVSAASPSMDHEHGTVCQPILERQIRLCAPSSVISRQTCFSSCSLRCCWQVGSAPFVRRRCDCSASSAPFTNIQTYFLTYNKSSNKILERWFCQEMKKLTTGTRLDTISQPDRQRDRRTDGRTFRRIYRGTRFSYGVAYFSHVTDVFSSHARSTFLHFSSQLRASTCPLM